MARPRADGVGALWKGALEDEVARATRSGAPLSLLLVELADAERSSPSRARLGAGGDARAVRPGGARAPCGGRTSSPARAIPARGSSPRTPVGSGAQALADRVAAAVRAAEPWRGAPLGVSAGVAVFRRGRRDVSELIEAAEEARFARRGIRHGGRP